MKNFLRAYCQTDLIRTEKPGEPIRFVASTAGEKRDGLDLEQDRWFLDNYRRNPVVLWVHDYYGRNLPIGRSVATVFDSELIADVNFDQEDDFARRVESKYRRGFLNAVSVGWDEIEQEGQKRYDLLDISAVPVPGDQDALMERQYRALQHIFEDTDPSGSGEAGWERAAARMAALFTLLADDTDPERETTYKGLLPSYRRNGKTPPDFQPAAELRKLTPDLVRGLFLAGEPDLFPEWFRPGLTLTARLQSNLRRSVDLILNVLDEATAPDPEDGKDADGLAELEAISHRLSAIGGSHG